MRADQPPCIRFRRDRGQAVVIVALMLWLMAACAMALSLLAARVVDRARAQAGADAVALAEAAAPGSGAAIAGSNEVVVFDRLVGASVTVTVDHGSERAVAAARGAPVSWQGLHPALQAALANAGALLGETIQVVSGLRSRAEQEWLWAHRATNPYPVARPGTSRHELGLAVDVPLAQADRLARIEALTGLCQPLPLIDPVHFILCETTPMR